MNKKAAAVRYDLISMLVPGESHHIGCSLSIVDLLTFLYFKILKINPKNPESPGRDIFILSKGHAAAALYAVLSQRGFFPKSLLFQYDRNGGRLPEHTSIHVPGVELSTGSLGHGLPVGIGFALSFLQEGKKNRVYVLLSDGELDEGSNWEAILFAGHHRLSNLTAIVDFNGFQGYGETKNILNLSPLKNKIEAFGWNYLETDGHDFKSLEKTFDLAAKKQKNKKPNFIVAKTVKGKGVPFFEGRFDSHYKSVTEEIKKQILEEF